ncbi:copper transport protein [Rhodopseudomonas rhenobacensis]|uniref:Copper transport protein n=1 Tax=Rhodopseudomonas rhenobacensis TaxID=87461 RepID=A0A7W8DY16_9BRAD|nr:CopD family protein [Rhodopseudomonas rhenobacensis]MBB5046355.1 copper transport protein [Rhodopseudomonas rhenobacensis]
MSGQAAKPIAKARSVALWLSRALLWIVLVLAQPGLALAHASLVSSDPVADAVLAVAPATLTLTFSDEVSPLVVRIIGSDGRAIEFGNIARRGPTLILTPPQPLQGGSYLLSWRVMSEDGHPVGGSFGFSIGAGAVAAPQLVRSIAFALQAAIWTVQLIIDIGLFVGIGGAFFAAWLQPKNFRGARGVSVTACVAALLAVGVAIGLQGLDALDAPASALVTSAVWSAGLRGSFGWSTTAAAAGLVLGLVSLWRPGTAARAAAVAAMLCVGATLALSGHAASATPRALASTAVFLHGVSLAFWIGALWPLYQAMNAPGEAALPTLRRFSNAIPWAVASLLGSGVALTLIELPRPDALWRSDYGRVLMIKLALVLILLAIAAGNRAWLTPRIARGGDKPRRLLRRSIVVELALVAIILGVVGLWRFTPPPAAIAAARQPPLTTEIRTDRVLAQVNVAAAAGGVEITVALTTPDKHPFAAQALIVTLARPELQIEPITAQARRGDDGRWRATLTTRLPGRWVLGLGILVDDFDKLSLEAQLELP